MRVEQTNSRGAWSSGWKKRPQVMCRERHWAGSFLVVPTTGWIISLILGNWKKSGFTSSPSLISESSAAILHESSCRCHNKTGKQMRRACFPEELRLYRRYWSQIRRLLLGLPTLWCINDRRFIADKNGVTRGIQISKQSALQRYSR